MKDKIVLLKPMKLTIKEIEKVVLKRIEMTPYLQLKDLLMWLIFDFKFRYMGDMEANKLKIVATVDKLVKNGKIKERKFEKFSCYYCD